MRLSKRLGVSFSAGQAIQPRWIMHYFRTQSDEASVKFIKALPIESHFGLMSFMGAAIIANRICGYKPSYARITEPDRVTITTLANSRSVTFDRIVEENVNQVEQIVVMGAGFDLRALRYSKGKDVKVFELDQRNTQDMKIETMKEAGIEHDHIAFVSVDFNEESWVEKLLNNGFDPTRRTLFLWESVAIYLEEDVIKDTLKKVADISAEGSLVAMDFYSTAFVKGESSSTLKRSISLMERMGEPWVFGIDMSGDVRRTVESFTKESGLALRDFTLFGKEDESNEPFYAISVFEKM
ncbi:MAG: SAM-dependent methyltransferase [Halobacteriota archaeon]|nr:SAM-dependent methyltransferase [Halobacteriota archaeon]